MTGDIITQESFQGIPVRVIDRQGKKYIPLNDIADALQVDRSGLQKLHKRHHLTLDKYSTKDKMSVVGKQREVILVTMQGMIGILNCVKPGASKSADIEDKIIQFQQWAIETLTGIVQGETVPVKREALEELVRQHLQIADAMVQYASVDRGIAASVALARVEFASGADLSWCKSLIRKDRQQEPGYLTPTGIGQELGGMYARSVNTMLQQLGYQKWTGGRWQPTELGKAYGENIPFTVTLRNGGQHSDYQLKWSPAIVEKLREHINGTRAIQAQTALTSTG